jgi:hypothetical protein
MNARSSAKYFPSKKAGGLATRRLLDWKYQPLTP